jgi:hypothetical protein
MAGRFFVRTTRRPASGAVHLLPRDVPATLLTDEAARRVNVFDIALRANRVDLAASWVKNFAAGRGLSLGLHGATMCAQASAVTGGPIWPVPLSPGSPRRHG